MSRARIESALLSVWYGRRRPPIILVVLAIVFRGVSALRRVAYRRGWLASHRVGVPIVVIGNITVGGSGKTPLTAWLASALEMHGIKVGIVTRGYGGRSKEWPQPVTISSDPAIVGDEAVLLARASGCPVMAGPDRATGAARLADKVDIILADDGLQHYRLQRDFEIVVIDGERGLGNGWLLPAGPLREPQARLGRVDCIVVKGGATAAARPGALSMRLRSCYARSLVDGQEQALACFRTTPVHALAGIGNPDAFFNALRQAGLNVIPHPLPDHATLSFEDLQFAEAYPVLMTEKDAVKLPATTDRRLWTVPAHVVWEEGHDDNLVAHIRRLIRVS